MDSITSSGCCCTSTALGDAITAKATTVAIIVAFMDDFKQIHYKDHWVEGTTCCCCFGVLPVLALVADVDYFASCYVRGEARVKRKFASQVTAVNLRRSKALYSSQS